MHRIGTLKNISVLAGLTDVELMQLARECRWRSFEEGEEIIRLHSESTDVCLLVSGRVRAVVCSATGRDVTFSDLQSGSSFGEIAAVDGDARSASVVALADCVVASMSAARFRKLLQEHHSVALEVLKNLAGLTRDLTTRVVDENTLTASSRIRLLLVRMARDAGVVKNQSTISPFPIHSELASRIGAVRERVTRELNALARAGLVKQHRGTLQVLDFDGLLRTAGRAVPSD